MKRFVVCALVLCSGIPATVFAQTGVSDDRVSLPEGPGSLEGVGENVDVDPNMGNMSYSVPINLPKGFAAVTPQLGLSYNSGGGGSVVGMGWSMPIPSIERMTYRKLPQYTLADDFAANGSEQLVLLPSTDPPVYRARYEKGFVRYTWMGAGEGTEGYWLAEYPDGSKGTFGATMDGTPVPNARVSGPDGTFRYMLVDKVDVYGHRVAYTYQKDGFASLVSHIGYVFTDEARPTYEVTFEYEERAGEGRTDYLSDAKPGFNELLTQRLAAINVLTRGVRIRRYALTYDPYNAAGGFTRLRKVETLGLEGGVYPIEFEFAYSQALGGVCDGEGCQRPFMTDMGSIGVSLASGRATLLDINGDSLPDILDTTTDGAHRFFLNIASEDGSTRLDPTPVLSQVSTGTEFRLGTAGVQVLDVNGDGFTDMLKATAAGGAVLLNQGQGDWAMEASSVGVQSLAEAFAGDFEEGELQQLKFIDYNGDKYIDVMRSTQDTTTVFENRGENGFAALNVEAIGRDFAADGMQFSDMNGDGLLDVVRVQPNTVSYRLNYGWGRWADTWTTISDLPISESEVSLAELEDINGDGLDDLVVVTSNTLKYAINMNTTEFAAPVTLTSELIQGELPIRDVSTTVLFADMNGNGSSDVVWISANGDVNALELFPVRPNLLSRVTNGIGQVTDVQYETAVVHMARDGGWEAWQYKLPYPMLVVSSVDAYDLLTNLHEVTEYAYHDGFYDGVEKQFRGFGRVETRLLSDETLEEGLTAQRYDVGAQDPYYSGLLLEESFSSSGRDLNSAENVYSECEVAEVPAGTEFPVKHICQTGLRVTNKEGLPEAEWVVTESQTTYDGYGNVATETNHGVVSIGAGGCEPCEQGRDQDTFGSPCGMQCLGDEIITESDYISTENTNGRWLLGKAYETRTYGRPGSDLVAVTRTYYDGSAFEGLPAGQLDQGKVTRVAVKRDVDSEVVIEGVRNAFDEHGNAIDVLDPNGEITGQTHRRRYAYDEDGLRVTRVEVLLEDEEGMPYRLRRDMQYEGLFDKVSESSQWMLVNSEGQVVSPPRNTTNLYDEFGRISATVKPGRDTLESPSEVYTYDLRSPVSRIIVQRRSEEGGPLDQEAIRCVDGRGRTVQNRLRLGEGSYQVDGFTTFNTRSRPVKRFQPFTSTTSQCDMAEPVDVLFAQTRYDALHRPIEVTLPDAALYGGAASVIRTEYRPLSTLRFDQEDNDPMSPHAGTPYIRHTDGQGRLVALERTLADGEPAVVKVRYDGLSRVSQVIDPAGNVKEQFYDLLGRVTRIIDPNSAGEALFQYDDVGNVVRSEDDRNVVTRTEYDGMNRPIAKWDEADDVGTRITWSYDRDSDCPSCTNAEGRVVSMRYPGPFGKPAQERLGYDQRGREIFWSRMMNDVTFEFDATYDNVDRLVAMGYPNARVVERTYDAANRLISIDGVMTDLTYTDRGQLSSASCADGSGSTTTYDDLMRPVEALTTGSAGEVLQGFAYTRNRAGHIMALESRATRPGALPFDATYQYDAWYRLLEARLGPEGPGQEVIEFEHDSIDNLLSQTSSRTDSKAAQGRYSYDSFAPNALTQVGDLVLEYDPAGNMNLRGEVGMTWDFMGRMTRAGDNTTMVYGSNQSRIAKQEGDRATLYLSDAFEVRDGISTLYVKMGRHRVARIEDDRLATALLSDLNSNAQVDAADAWLTLEDDPSASGPWLWSSVRRLLVETGPEDGVTFLHHDHLGSITLATAAQGGSTEVVGERSYYPVGQIREEVGYVDEYGFTGQEIDRSTGLLHFDWRYYDPQLGRWLSIDPLFETSTPANVAMLGESTSGYTYVTGDFVNSFDPTGLLTKKEIRAKIKKLKKRKTRKEAESSYYMSKAEESFAQWRRPLDPAAVENYAVLKATGQVTAANKYFQENISQYTGGGDISNFVVYAVDAAIESGVILREINQLQAQLNGPTPPSSPAPPIPPPSTPAPTLPQAPTPANSMTRPAPGAVPNVPTPRVAASL